MRRKSTTTALSPKLLKHFAAATMVLTALLAVFASGEDWGAQAQVQAVQAKNQLANTENEKLGIKRIGAAVKIANAASKSGFAENEGTESSGGGGLHAQPAPQAATTASPTMPGATVLAASSVSDMLPPMPGGKPAPAKAKPVQSKAPSPAEIAQIAAKSAQRSGAGSLGD